MIQSQTNFLKELLEANPSLTDLAWIDENLNYIIKHKDTQKLYLTYSLLASKSADKPLLIGETKVPELAYLHKQIASFRQLSRVYLLASVLKADFDFFGPKVAQIIQVADQGELITFLKFLVLLPRAEYFKDTAVEALRTNITPVFEAISMNNPYPELYFNEQQWNQMYLKAAFMQLNLGQIMGVEKRANAELARIISDYAHERWAASRDIDPMIWRPVSLYLNDELLADMDHLLKSDQPSENIAAALCCCHSSSKEALELLESVMPELYHSASNNELNWNQLYDLQ
ncbi:MAG: EboA domain-containing protein [Flavobacteriaceae bacterium]